jgi:hypothetical protein
LIAPISFGMWLSSTSTEPAITYCICGMSVNFQPKDAL